MFEAGRAVAYARVTIIVEVESRSIVWQYPKTVEVSFDSEPVYKEEPYYVLATSPPKILALQQSLSFKALPEQEGGDMGIGVDAIIQKDVGAAVRHLNEEIYRARGKSNG